MHKIRFDKDVYIFPSAWNELTRPQFLSIASRASDMTDFGKLRSELLLSMFGFSVRIKPQKTIDDSECFYLYGPNKKLYLVDPAELALLVDKLDWIFIRNNEGEYHINSKLTRNLLPEIKVGNTTWYGPADALTNIIFLEHIHAETAFYYLHKKKDESFINRLIAVLYRPEIAGYNPDSIDYKGDRREVFNDFLLERRQEEANKISSAVKNGILLWYTGCRVFLERKFPNALGHSDTETDEASSKDEVFMSYMKMVNALTNNDVTKNDQLRQSLLYEVLVTMEALAVQDKKMKELYKK